MDASQLSLRSCVFDAVFCVQNGISAFRVNKKRLIAESLRVTKDNGIILFSSYSPKIWEARLEWFRKPSLFGLIWEIGEEKTRDGTIVCKDGFKATTVSSDQFVELFNEYGLNASIAEVDESSIFCKTIKKKLIANIAHNSKDVCELVDVGFERETLWLVSCQRSGLFFIAAAKPLLSYHLISTHL